MQTHRKPVDHEEALLGIRDSSRSQRGSNTPRRPLEPVRPAVPSSTPRESHRTSHALSIGEYPMLVQESTPATATATTGGVKQQGSEQGSLPRPILKKPPSAACLDPEPVPRQNRPPARRRIEFFDSEPPAYSDFASSQSDVTPDASGVPVWSPSQETCMVPVPFCLHIDDSVLMNKLYACSCGLEIVDCACVPADHNRL